MIVYNCTWTMLLRKARVDTFPWGTWTPSVRSENENGKFLKMGYISANKIWPFFLEIPIIKVEASITAYKNTVYLEKAKVNAFLSTCLLAFLMFSINFWLFSNYTVSKFSTDLDRKLKSVCIAAATSHNWFYGLKQIHVNFYHVPVERICSHKFTLQTL